jgi:hypothetical protein
LLTKPPLFLSSSRFFARGIYKEQMLDRQKANRIKFRAEPMEKRSSQSKEEELELRKGEAKY